jgi:hypothetical protein
MGRYWSDEPRRFTIDLAVATTPERLRAALAKHFDMGADIRELSCAISVARQECPYHIEFLHWGELEQHMPKYARRLKRHLDDYSRCHSHALVVEYGTGTPAPAKRRLASRKSASAPGKQPKSVPEDEPFAPLSSNSVYQPLNYIVLEPVAKPTVEQIRAVRDLGLGNRGRNMLETRHILAHGGFACFGELMEGRAKEISSRLSAVRIPHRIEKTPIRHIIVAEGGQHIIVAKVRQPKEG